MNFLIMSWAVFAVGAAVLAFFIVKRMEGATAPQITAMLLPPIVLILAALFAPNLTGLKVGAEGFEFNLQTAKAAATAAVEQQPEIAEAITAKKGDEAVAAAKEKILSAKSWGGLEQVLPFEVKDNSIVFYPKADTPQATAPVKVQPSKSLAGRDRYSVEVLRNRDLQR